MNFFSRPYPLETSPKKQLLTVFWFALFVFAFLYFFRPFGLGELKNGLLFSAVGFGLITLILNGGLQALLPNLFRAYFNEENWTLGRNILIASLIIIVVAFGNFSWALYLGFTPFSLLGLLTFLVYTVAVGVFPMSFLMVIQQNRLTKKHLSESNNINEHLVDHKEVAAQQASLSFKSEDNKVAISLANEDFYYCKSADNYIELYYQNEGVFKRELFRNSLKSIEADFAENKSIERIHRSYLVNFNKVKSVAGNARGLKLKLHAELPEIPVSRAKHDEILAVLDSH